MPALFAYFWEKREDISTADSVRAYLMIAVRCHLLKAFEQQQQRQTSHRQFERQRTQDAFSPEGLLIVQEKECQRLQPLLQLPVAKAASIRSLFSKRAFIPHDGNIRIL